MTPVICVFHAHFTGPQWRRIENLRDHGTDPVVPLLTARDEILVSSCVAQVAHFRRPSRMLSGRSVGPS